MNRVKEFYKKHEDIIVTGGVVAIVACVGYTIGLTVVSKEVTGYEIENIYLSDDSTKLRVNFKNGNQRLFDRIPD